MDFTNKVVIITGAGSGLGEAIALEFAKSSASLSLLDLNKNNLHKVAEQCEKLNKLKVLEVSADVTNDDEAKQAVNYTIKEFGKIDVVVNCVGIYAHGTILDDDLLSCFDRVMKVNLRSTVSMVHYAAPALIESKGCVINIASTAASIVGQGLLTYCVSKAAISHFTRGVALDLADKGVRVNCISPGAVKTNILVNAGMDSKKSDEFFEGTAKLVPLQRNVDASEIANMAVYLASDKAKSITGSDFAIDSGHLLVGFPYEAKK